MIPFSYVQTNFDPIALSYFSRAGIISSREKLAVNNFVLSCKSNAAIWASLQGGAVYLVSPTSIGASMYNLISSAFTISIGTSPTYSTSGWSFVAASSQYLKTGFVPSVNMSANTGGVDVYMRGYTPANTFFYGSITTDGTNAWGFGLRTAVDTSIIHVYNNTPFSPVNTNNIGTFSFNIRSNTDREFRRNGVQLGATAVAAGGALPAFETYIGGRNINGTPGTYCTGVIATLIQRTVGLDSTNTDILRGFIDIYNANVIPGGR